MWERPRMFQGPIGINLEKNRCLFSATGISDAMERTPTCVVVVAAVALSGTYIS